MQGSAAARTQGLQDTKELGAKTLVMRRKKSGVCIRFIHLFKNILGKVMNPPFPPSYGLISIKYYYLQEISYDI